MRAQMLVVLMLQAVISVHTELVTVPVAAAKGNMPLVAWAAAFFAYLSTVTFGQTLGVVLMVAAFATFGVAMVLAISTISNGNAPAMRPGRRGTTALVSP